MAKLKEMKTEMKLLESKISIMMAKLNGLEHGSVEFMNTLKSKETLCEQHRELKRKLYANKHPCVNSMYNFRNITGK